MQTIPKTTKILAGHISPETAYLVSDYPYGFRLRCKIRYWLEEDAKHGVRFCSQTTNPKRAGDSNGDFWNRPRKSTYSPLAGCMFLDEAGYVTWTGAHYYSEAAELKTWLATFRAGLSAQSIEALARHLVVKDAFNAEQARGEFNVQGCGIVASLIGRRRKDGTLTTLEQAQAAVRSTGKLNAY